MRTHPSRSAGLGLWIAAVLAAGIVALPSPSAAERVDASGGDSASGARPPAPGIGGPTSTISTTSTVLPPTTARAASAPTATSPPSISATPPVAEVEGGIPLSPDVPREGPSDVSGTVRDSSGHAVGDACIEIFHNALAPWGLVGEMTSGANGRYETTLQLITEADDVVVRVQDCRAEPRFAVTVAQMRISPLQAYVLDVTVDPAAIVTGTVVDDDFHQVDATGLCIRIDGSKATVLAPVSPNGRFRVVGVPVVPQASVWVMESCDELNGITGTVYVPIGPLRAGEEVGVMVVIPHGPRSKA